MKKTTITKAVFALILLFSFFPLFSQSQNRTQTIRGLVVEKLSLVPIEYAAILVQVEGKDYSAMSDSLGVFRIEDVPVGRCKLSVSIMGYLPYQNNNVLHLSKKETILQVVLQESVTKLDEVLVTATSNKNEALNKMAGVSSRMLSVEEANRYAGSIGDPARMASNLAGVVAANDTRNDIIIRANSPSGVLWRIDGFDVENPNHFGSMGGTGGPVGMINNNQLANSDFYTGAFPAEFGNATAGVFDLRLRKGNNEKHEFLAGIGFNGVELGAEGPFSKKRGATYMINARYSFLKILSLARSMESLKSAVPDYQDVSFKLDFPMKNANLSLVGVAGRSHINFKDDMTDAKKWDAGDIGEDTDMRNLQSFTGLNYTYRFSRKTRLENRFGFQYFSSRQRVSTIGFQKSFKETMYAGDLKELRYAYSSSLHHRFGVKDYLVGGVAGTRYESTMNESMHPDSVTTKKILSKGTVGSTLLSGHLQWEHAFNDELKITPGVHAQYYDLSKDYSIEPRLGIKWKASSKINFNLGAGIYSQIQPRQLILYKTEEGESINTKLKMNKSAQAVFGVDLSLAQSLHLKTEFYYQQLYELPVMTDIPEESAINFGDDFYNRWHNRFVSKGKGRNYGVELTLEKFFENNYYFLITASLYDSKYTALDKVERNSRFNGKFSLNTLFGYEWQLGKNNQISLNGKLSWLGGKRYVPISRTSPDVKDITRDYSQAYTLQLPNYFKADLNLSMKNNFKQFSVEWFVEVNNLSNHKNILTQYYDIKKQKQEYVYQMGLQPGGGVKIYF